MHAPATTGHEGHAPASTGHDGHAPASAGHEVRAPATGHEGHAPASAGHEGPAPATTGRAPASTGHEGHAPPSEGHAPPDGEAPPLPEGHAEVEIAPDRLQLIGVRLARAERTSVAGQVRASAVVQPDERREAHVHSKLMGWIDRLYVNTVGQQVKRGDPLYSLYSQDLFAAQQEYANVRRTHPDLAAAARERLRLWDVPEDQIKLIEQKGPQRTVVFRSPIGGTVLEKMVLRGHFIEPGMMLYRIADLSEVWILSDVYEFEVQRVDRTGTAEVRVQGLEAPFRARVDYVYPTVDPATRTVRIRLVAANPAGLLRPGSFATVLLPTVAGEALTVPEEAVIDTGRQQIVYVAVGPGRFRPVAVTVGRRGEGRVEVRGGLREGDEVVASAQFLIDSESRLRATDQPMGHGGH